MVEPWQSIPRPLAPRRSVYESSISVSRASATHAACVRVAQHTAGAASRSSADALVVPSVAKVADKGRIGPTQRERL